jgi:hypothetical protein
LAHFQYDVYALIHLQVACRGPWHHWVWARCCSANILLVNITKKYNQQLPTCKRNSRAAGSIESGLLSDPCVRAMQGLLNAAAASTGVWSWHLLNLTQSSNRSAYYFWRAKVRIFSPR